MNACTTSTNFQRGTTRVDNATGDSGRFKTLPVASNSRGGLRHSSVAWVRGFCEIITDSLAYRRHDPGAPGLYDQTQPNIPRLPSQIVVFPEVDTRPAYIPVSSMARQDDYPPI